MPKAKSKIAEQLRGLLALYRPQQGSDVDPTGGLHLIMWVNFPTLDINGHHRIRLTSDLTVGSMTYRANRTYYLEVPSGRTLLDSLKTALTILSDGDVEEYSGDTTEGPYVSSQLSAKQLKTYIFILLEKIRLNGRVSPEECLSMYAQITKLTAEDLFNRGVHVNLKISDADAMAMYYDICSPSLRDDFQDAENASETPVSPEETRPSVTPTDEAAGNTELLILSGQEGKPINPGDDTPNADLKEGFALERKTLAQIGASEEVQDVMASGKVGAASKEAVAIFLQIEEYFGFDPVRMVETMTGLAKAAKVLPSYTFDQMAGKMSYEDIPQSDKDYGRKRVKNDARWLIALFSMRGVNFDKQEKKMDKDAALLNGQLLARYKISRRPTLRKDLGPTIVTLPRIAASFAADTCWLQCKGMLKPIVPYSTIVEENKAVPMCLFGTQMPALIPQDERKYTYAPLLKDLAMWVAWKFDDRIKSDGKKPLTPVDQMETYFQAARTNRIYSDSARNSFLRGLGILTANNELMPNVRDVALKASTDWQDYKRSEGSSRGGKPGTDMAGTIAAVLRDMGFSPENRAPAEEAED